MSTSPVSYCCAMAATRPSELRLRRSAILGSKDMASIVPVRRGRTSLGCGNVGSAPRQYRERLVPFGHISRHLDKNEEARTENGTDPNGWMSANYSGRTW